MASVASSVKRRAVTLRLYRDQGRRGRSHQIRRGRLRGPRGSLQHDLPGDSPIPLRFRSACGAPGDYEAARAAFIARQPIGRIGKPEEIADLALYLATATYTTGQIHVIDGGWVN